MSTSSVTVLSTAAADSLRRMRTVMDQLLSGERLWRSDAPAIAEVLRCAPEELAVVAVEFEGYTVLAA